MVDLMNHNEGDKMDNNNQKPNGWGQNKGMPEAWRKQNNLPEGWGKQSLDNSTNINTGSIYDTARSDAEKLSDTTIKVSNTIKNAANHAAEFAKSDEVKDKLNAAKNKAKSLAGGAGSAFANLKEKTGEAINERRAAMEKSSEISNNIENQISDSDISENSTSDLENKNINNEQAFNEVPKADINEVAPTVNNKSVPHYENYASSPPAECEIPTRKQIEEEPIYQTQEKKSSKKPIIIGIISGLSVCAVFAGVLIFLGHINGNTNNDNHNVLYEPTENTETTTKMQTEIATEVVTEYETTAANKDDEDDDHSHQISFSNDINDYPLYLERLHLIRKNTGYDNYDYGSELSIAYTYSDTTFGYTLQDLNKDGNPELITIAGEMSDGASSVAEIYTISNNELVMLCQTADRLWYYLCENNIIASCGIGNGSGGVNYYKYTGGSDVEIIDTYSWEIIDGEELSYINGKRVSNDEITKIENKYQSIVIDDMISLPDVPSSSNLPSPHEYTFEEIKSNAGSDFSFYAYSGPYTIVNTERDPLNLRATPSTNSDIITTIPKGTYVTAHASNNEWSLISYYNEENDTLYYGFASNKYLLN